MTSPDFETCEQCGTHVRVDQTVEVFGQAVKAGAGPVSADVVECARGHRFLPRSNDGQGLAPDRA